MQFSSFRTPLLLLHTIFSQEKYAREENCLAINKYGVARTITMACQLLYNVSEVKRTMNYLLSSHSITT